MENLNIIFGELQDKIIQFIIPTLVAAIVSVITLIVNTSLTIRGEIIKKRKDTYENMKSFYPEFRTKLICINAIFSEIKLNGIYSKVCSGSIFNLTKFIQYDLDNFIDQYQLEEEQDLADSFLLLVQRLKDEVVSLNLFLKNQIVPIHNKEAKRILLELHEYCVFISWLCNEQNREEMIILNENIYNFDNIAILMNKLDEIFHKS